MPANKYALLRYRIIDRMIGNKYSPFPSKEELRSSCEESLYGSHGDNISISTIEKDLKAMREEAELAYYAPIKYSKLEKGYFYEDPDFSIEDIPLNDDDLEAIKFAATTLFQFKGISLFNQFESAIDKIFNRLNITTDVQDTNLNDFVQFDAEVNFKGKEYLQPMLDAIRKQNVSIMSYQGFNRDTPSKAIIHPYFLKEFNNRWYLLCFHTGKEKIITYALDRIKAFSVDEDTFFQVQKSFNRKKYFRHCFGITHLDDEPCDVLISFKPLQGKYIKTQKIHPTQKIVLENDDEVRVSIKVNPTFELVEKLLSFGANAKVLEPLELRDRVRGALEEALKGY
jgi:predicted DNA-binding transcriptional regulator YafY